ncbi:hypothetical protein ABT013_00695 [Streptomyces bacillaris]|uniref:Peptidase inhibitor family I36 n=2 Tax=Streptomyces TaxID=1883 RepID=A0A1E7LUS7_9ACTN|nr:hypothetical protein [Streptomyces nanshensis]OEV19999.1 hypothetical protein AN221_14735 [Streptomyces nanshensis]
MTGSKLKQRLTGAAGVLALTAGLGVAGTAPAQAAPKDCPYPYVCFYQGNGKTGQYKDVTSGYQSVGRSSSATSIYNSRNDDVVYVRYSDGLVVCAPPKKQLNLSRYPAKSITGVRISSSPKC